MILGLCGVAHSQVVIEPELRTDTIDIFKPVVQSDKSRTVATLGSLLLPGLGHAYLGKDNAAMGFFTSEALLVFGAIFCERTSKHLFDDAKSYAYVHASVQGGSAADEKFWKAMSVFMDMKAYNDVMDLNRSSDDKLSIDWRWEDKSFMDHYAGLREKATRFHVASSFFVAGMLLDRVVAFVQIRQSMRHHAVAMQPGVQMRPALGVSADGATFALQGSF